MGSEAVVQAAEQYGKNFICSEKIEAVDLQDLCYKVAINYVVSYSFCGGILRKKSPIVRSHVTKNLNLISFSVISTT